MNNVTGALFLALASVGVVACGSPAPPPQAPPAEAPASPSSSAAAEAPANAPASAGATTSAADQVALGAKLYGEHCAGCHGDSGEGNARAPAVVGKGALPLDAKAPSKARTSKFHTAADVFAFVKATMPPKNPGSPTDAEYAAILAFDLKANGVDLGDTQLDASNAARFVLHP